MVQYSHYIPILFFPGFFMCFPLSWRQSPYVASQVETISLRSTVEIGQLGATAIIGDIALAAWQRGGISQPSTVLMVDQFLDI